MRLVILGDSGEDERRSEGKANKIPWRSRTGMGTARRRCFDFGIVFRFVKKLLAVARNQPSGANWRPDARVRVGKREAVSCPSVPQ